jgi:hypothetical protein
VRQQWTFRQKRRPGRPPLTEEIQEWVLRLARENPHWGSKKIQGKMLKLGLKVSRTTVARCAPAEPPTLPKLIELGETFLHIRETVISEAASSPSEGGNSLELPD